MSGRNDVFQRLKPPCVALSQVALAFQGSHGNSNLLVTRLDELQSILTSVASHPALLDAKLADYVFFPLSQVLKVSQRVPIRALELALRCLAIIIEHGWRSKIQPPLAAQVVILCTLMAEENPKGLSAAQTTDELRSNSLECLRHVFEAAGESVEAQEVMTAESNVPQLGQTISTILDSILGSQSAQTQISGSCALQALMTRVASRDIQAGFLPGIVSKLTKVLTPTTAQRRNHQVLVRCLDTLTQLFRRTLEDRPANRIILHDADDRTASLRNPVSKVIDQKWLETAASQLKPAIANIIKIQDSDRHDVKASLAGFCLTILRCHQILESSTAMCLETLLNLSSEANDGIIRAQLEMLISQNSAMLGLLQSTLHGWLSSLPTRMQAADKTAKVQFVRQIRTAYEIMTSSERGMIVIERMLAETLGHSVVIILQDSHSVQKENHAAAQIQSMELDMAGQDAKSMEFKTSLVKQRFQRELMQAVEDLVRLISTRTPRIFLQDLSRSLRQSIGETQIATFWLLYNATQATLDHARDFNDLLSMDSETQAPAVDQLESLYVFSLEVLADDSNDTADARLRTLALRSLALQCKTAGRDFRHELVDALFPVLHSLATPDTLLQQDSMTTLNIFASFCAYSSVESLIVENVDYLTNAVALRLNAFDVSPQAPQVLLMMVRLAGPKLLPYLEDTVESLFAALQDYHGYPLLVELIFRVLSVVAEEGVKAPQLAIEHCARQELARYYEDSWQPTTIGDLVEFLQEQVAEEERLAQPDRSKSPSHPRRPWESSAASDASTRDVDEPQESEEQGIEIPDPPPPAPKTYSLLLRISDLTQHFLPSASAALRTSLLNLIKTTTPAIARHENSFLPLINTLWPEIVARLDDSEPYVVDAALDLIAMLCEYAGPFMRTRIEQLWPALQERYRTTAAKIVEAIDRPHLSTADDQRSLFKRHGRAHLSKALKRMEAAPPEYSDKSTRRSWEALLAVIVSTVKHVSLTPEMFDDALDMLAPVLDDDDTRATLETENVDAVWLLMLRSGTVNPPELHDVDETIYPAFVRITG